MPESLRGFDPLKKNEPSLQVGKSWFFGIGIDKYQHFSNLNNAVKDVKDIINLLQEKYELEEDYVITLFDEEADRRNIIRKLDWLQREVAPEDKLLIYYSGHGHLVKRGQNNKGYWIPTDAEKDYTSQYIRNSTIRDCIEDIDSLHTLLISDACFSGSLFVQGRNRSNIIALEELEQKKSRWAICSGRHDELVHDGKPGTNSPFAISVLEVLSSNQQEKLNVAKLADRVMELTRANNEQLPEANPLSGVGHKGGQYVFCLKQIKGERFFTDSRDGQVYKTVEINGKIWLAENLNYDVGENCWSYDNEPKNGEKYGRLYTWKTAQKACPPGWHLPTNEEWKALSDYSGGSREAYSELIKGGQSGFDALLGGAQVDDYILSIGVYGNYWSATDHDVDYARAYACIFDNDYQELRWGKFTKGLGFSVRCLQD